MSTEDIDEFLDRVDYVQKSVLQLRHGAISLDAHDQQLKKKAAAEVVAQQAAVRAQERGRDGKGAAGQYEVFCRRCHVEYVVKYDKCNRCNGPVITQEVRQAELKIAVDQLRAQKAERQRRRERWQHFKAQRAQSNSVVITSDVSAESQPLASYQSWDAWEPSESDSETAGPAFDTNQPALREMEKDIEERNKAAAERKANADKLKDQGNAAFAKGEISYAIRLYSDAIDLKRDQKAYYCNRALAYLKLRPTPDWASALKDCNTVIDMWEIFENRETKQAEVRELVCKALLRRMAAQRGLGMYAGAADDAKTALSIKPDDIEITKLRDEIARERADRQAAAAMLGQAVITSTVGATETSSANPASPPSSEVENRGAVVEEIPTEPNNQAKATTTIDVNQLSAGPLRDFASILNDISEMGSKFEKQLGELSSKQSNQSSEVGTSNAAAPSLLAGATTAVAAACDTLQTLTERLISATSQLREHLVVDGKPAPLVTVLRQSGSLDVILNLARGLFEFLYTDTETQQTSATSSSPLADMLDNLARTSLCARVVGALEASLVCIHQACTFASVSDVDASETERIDAGAAESVRRHLLHTTHAVPFLIARLRDLNAHIGPKPAEDKGDRHDLARRYALPIRVWVLRLLLAMSEHTDGRAALSATPARCERLLSLIVSVLRTSPCASDSVLPQQVGAVWAGAAAASGLICNLMLDKRMRVHLRTFGRAATALSSTGNEFNAPIFAELLPWLSASPVQAPVAAASRAVRRAVERDQRKSDPNTFTVEVDVADTRDRVLAALGNLMTSPVLRSLFVANAASYLQPLLLLLQSIVTSDCTDTHTVHPVVVDADQSSVRVRETRAGIETVHRLLALFLNVALEDKAQVAIVQCGQSESALQSQLQNGSVSSTQLVSASAPMSASALRAALKAAGVPDSYLKQRGSGGATVEEIQSDDEEEDTIGAAELTQPKVVFKSEQQPDITAVHTLIAIAVAAFQLVLPDAFLAITHGAVNQNLTPFSVCLPAGDAGAYNMTLDRSLALLARLCRRPEARSQLLVPGNMTFEVRTSATSSKRLSIHSVDLLLHILSASNTATRRESALRILLFCAEAAATLSDDVLNRIAAFRTSAVNGTSLLSEAVGSSNRLLAGNAALAISKLALKESVLPSMGSAIAPLIELLKKDASRAVDGVDASTAAAAQKNSAVALARLAKHAPHAQRIRDLRGMEILIANAAKFTS